MKRLYDLIVSHEDWLMRRILYYVRERKYVKYMPASGKTWRMSVRGLSKSLLAALKTIDNVPEPGMDDDFTRDSAASFFRYIVAQRHRERGITLGMFLGLLKYYRRSYLDLVHEVDFEQEYEEYCRLFIERVFDRIEIGFCMEWAKVSEEQLESFVNNTTDAVEK